MVTHCSRVLVGVGELNRFQASGLPLPTPRFKASSNLPSPPHQMPHLPQVQGIKDTIKSMTATGPYLPTAADRIATANDSYLGSETQKQEQLIR